MIEKFITGASKILKNLSCSDIDKLIRALADIRERQGRLFLIGVGGSAGNCSHAVNDFRKLAGIETYSPVDNVSELTARTNDEGWDTVFSEWLKGSNLCQKDGVLVFSVGGGDKERGISANLVYALEYAKRVKAKIMGIVGRDGGYTAKVADACVLVPAVDLELVTPLTEGFQSLIAHLIVSDPRLMRSKNKWESTNCVKAGR